MHSSIRAAPSPAVELVATTPGATTPSRTPPIARASDPKAGQRPVADVLVDPEHLGALRVVLGGHDRDLVAGEPVDRGEPHEAREAAMAEGRQRAGHIVEGTPAGCIDHHPRDRDRLLPGDTRDCPVAGSVPGVVFES